MKKSEIKNKEIEKISIFSLKNLGMAVMYPKDKLIISKKVEKL
jgi:hypothetical protein